MAESFPGQQTNTSAPAHRRLREQVAGRFSKPAASADYLSSAAKVSMRGVAAETLSRPLSRTPPLMLLSRVTGPAADIGLRPTPG
jgi:hypothetical protein